MRRSSFAPLWVFTALPIVFLAGCGESVAPEPAETPTKTAPPTKTSAPSKTGTPILSMIPAETPTETPTLSPMPAYNQPGTYYIYKCTGFQLTGIPVYISIKFCVTSVKVNADRTMKFYVTWKLNNSVPGRLTKRSDVGNNNMFLYDDLGNEYHSTEWGGAAAEDRRITQDPDVGWFLFPAPKPGAKVFRFYDFDNRISIDDIVLLPKIGTDTPTQTRTALQGTPYNEPGTYWFYKCVTYIPGADLSGVTSIRFCVNTVVVNEDRTMRFNVAWTFFEYTRTCILKKPTSNIILLEDDLGNEFKAVKVGGFAAMEKCVIDGDTVAGWYQFEPAKPGATSFRLVDVINHFAIEDIVLVPKAE